MSTRLFLFFLCTAIGTLCGYMVLLSHKRNFVYVNDVCAMISALKQNLSYKKDAVSIVLGGLNVSSAQLKKNIDEYISFANGQADKQTLSRGFLPQSTFECMKDFFGAIGNSDESSQAARLDALAVRFEKLRDAVENKYKKFGSVAVKLGFLAGLGVGILIL